MNAIEKKKKRMYVFLNVPKLKGVAKITLIFSFLYFNTRLWSSYLICQYCTKITTSILFVSNNNGIIVEMGRKIGNFYRGLLKNKAAYCSKYIRQLFRNF